MACTPHKWLIEHIWQDSACQIVLLAASTANFCAFIHTITCNPPDVIPKPLLAHRVRISRTPG